jgi:hypothetical protein
MTYHVPIGRHNITELGGDFGKRGGFLHPKRSKHEMVVLDYNRATIASEGAHLHHPHGGPLSIERGGKGQIRIRQVGSRDNSVFTGMATIFCHIF